ncbi:MAG: endo-1,4-beta-xylanase [Muribaculaceae bacterium]|nr:endo-1,4-beta-xylanase [Muribaculaceae bacterium]
MKTMFWGLALLAMTASACGSSEKTAATVTVKDHFKNDFLIGAAIPVNHVNGLDQKADSVVSLHFNSVVAENCMKCEKIHPEADRYFWDDADAFVKYGEERDMAVIGHCLVWHSQLAPWFPYDENGKYVSAEVFKERLRDHIHTIVGRYKGRIHGWDVVNEAIEDDGSYRHTPFYDILGEEFIPLAFQYAHEADPDAELYLNDFSMAIPAKREAYVRIIGELKNRGLRIDGMGMQSHIGIDYPDMEEYEKTIVALGNAGVSVMVTELDMTALPTVNFGANVDDNVNFNENKNPYPDSLPDEVSKEWNDRMASVFRLYKKHSDLISRVTFWGTHDGMSWRNDWPMHGRTDYPLLFDRNYEMKPFMVKELAEEETEK